MTRHLIPFLTVLSAAAAPVPPALFTCSDPTLEVTVWAASPLFNNPTNIDIDQHGRIWVAEGVNYRRHFNRRPEGDRIMVLEDTDKDGTADKSWCFVQEKFLRAPLGVAVIGDKVVVSMAPDLIVYTDKDHDAVFDPAKGDTREVLLTGFNGRNHDHSLHSVTVGPDGKWYFSAGNCGAKFTDKSGKTFRIAAAQNWSWWPKDPGLPDWDPNTVAGQKSDDGKVYAGGFIARMNPDGTNVEILAHNLRNSYENCVTSFGDIFASDNDDQPACRVFAVLEGGNYGFASADGQRPWAADRRPGQSIATATWRQEDPGVAPAGDIYGGGAPTGCVFYENGALGPRHEGTLLVCESARNTIFGYRHAEKPGAQPGFEFLGQRWERFAFLTTNKAGEFAGTDFKGGDKGIKADDTKTLFRPSDIAVGPDGALYISDWHDPRTGGHADMDDALEGTIYRVAPKGFKTTVPKIDKTGVEGYITALKSPAVHVRALGAAKLKLDDESKSKLLAAVKEEPALVLARAIRVAVAARDLPFGAELARLAKSNKSEIAYVVGEFDDLTPPTESDFDLLLAAGEISEENTTGILREDRLFLRCCQNIRRLKQTKGTIAALGLLTATGDLNKSKIPAWRLACSGKESAIYDLLLSKAEASSSSNRSEDFAALAFQLCPPQSIPPFKTRALSPKLSIQARLDALTAIGFNDTKEAAEAMLEVAVKTDAAKDPLLRTTALWWLLNRKDSTWKAHHLPAALKEKGLYDPDKVTLLPFPTPEPPPPAFTVADALKLTGDSKRGEAVIAKCYLCHKAGTTGAEYGPDLTTWARTQPTDVILRSIIDPSADIAHGFAGTRLELTDGLIIDGLLLTDADPLIIQSQGAVTQMVPRHKLKAKTNLPRSLMLSATQLALTPQDAADLAAWLKAR